LGFVSGIKKLPRRGNRVEEFVSNNSMLLRITACYQRSLIDLVSDGKTARCCLHLTPSRAKRCRFGIVSSETMSGRRASKQRIRKRGRACFMFGFRMQLSLRCCLEIKIAKPNLTCITPFNHSMTMRNRFFGQDVGIGVA